MYKQICLVALAIGVLAFSILPTVDGHIARLFAQTNQQSPLATTPFFTPTFTLTPTITLTPEPTPTKGNITEIEIPQPKGVLFGVAEIVGTALVNEYLKYELHISEANSENWRWLTTGYDIVRGGVLYSLDTNEFADGFYDLRLRAISRNGNYREVIVRSFEIRNTNPPTATSFVNEAGTLVPPSPIETPTPTPDIRMRIPGGQGFYGPPEGAAIRGAVPILATVNNLGDRFFQRYELYISPRSAESWSHLITSDRQFWQDTIYVLDTLQFPDGAYDLRLRVVFEDANYSEYHLRNLRIDNRSTNRQFASVSNGIYKPQTGAHVSGIVEFVGTAIDPNFLRWELDWSGRGEENWVFLVSSDKAVINDLLARLDLSLLPAGEYDFRLRVVRTDNNYAEYIVRRIRVIPPVTSTPMPTPIPTQIPTPTSTP